MPSQAFRHHKDRILVAIDTPDVAGAQKLSRQLQGHVGGIKLGLEFFNANGPAGVRAVIHGDAATTPRGQAIPNQHLFLDLKFHDIPHTVAGAVRSVVPLNPKIITIHAAAGPEMMRQAVAAAKFAAEPLGIMPPMVVGVTLLTSMGEKDLDAVGIKGSTRDQVLRLAVLAKESGLDGVVCSARETTAIRRQCGPDFTVIVPGIRPAGSDKGDQKRIMTPREAVDAGADYLVIGRPLTQAPDPVAAVKAMLDTLAG